MPSQPLAFEGAPAPSVRPASAALGALLVALALLFFAAQASADGRIAGPHPGGSLAFRFQAGGMAVLSGIAVSEAQGGDVYFPNSGFLQRVDQFAPDGSWVRAFGFGIVPGAASGTGDLTAGSKIIAHVTTTSGSFNQLGLGGKLIAGPGIPPDTTILAVTSTELLLSNPAEETRTSTLAVATGPGNLPTDERQTVTIGGAPTGGTFTLTFTSPQPGSTSATATLPFNATAAEVQAALNGLPNLGSGAVAVSGPAGGPWTIEFSGSRYADTNVLPLAADAAGLTPTVATPTEGGGALETCTTVCGAPSADENTLPLGANPVGSAPGQLDFSDEIAVDNEPGSEYGDLYLVDQRNFRVEKYDPEGHLLLIFGGGVDHSTGANVCTAADIAAGDVCGAGLPGTGPAHFYQEEPQTQAGGFKSWAEQGSNSIAVGPGGRVYVGDYGRVQEFNPDGTFLGELALPDAEPRFVSSLAVAPAGTPAAGDIYERSATYTHGGLSQVPGVREYSPAHSFIRTIDAGTGSEPTHIALDAEGDVFLSDFDGAAVPSTCKPLQGEMATCPEETFRAYKPSGAPYAEFSSPQVRVAAGTRDDPGGIAIGAAAKRLYATTYVESGGYPNQVHEDYVAAVDLPVTGAPTVSKEEAPEEEIEPTRATLHGVVNPRGFDTEYHFDYITEEDFENDGSAFGAGTESTPSTDIGLFNAPHPVQASISSLIPKTRYRWRLIAESECEPLANPGHICVTKGEGVPGGQGTDATFETLPPVSVRGFTTQTVGPELLTLKAELNPNNGTGTEYTIRYGTGADYSCEPGNTCSAHGTLPVGGGFVKLESEGTEGVTFTGLKPDTTYHYQLTARNSYGDTETADAEFTTEPSQSEENAAADCPNQTRREEDSSLALPDCRAYEQVSAAHKEGGQAYPQFEFAPSGERLRYIANGAFAGAGADEVTVYYLAQRSPSGWSSRAPVVPLAGPAYQPGGGDTLDFSPELDRWIYSESPGLAFQQQRNEKSLFYSMGFADGTSLAHATPTLEPLETSWLPGPIQYTADSNDLSRLFFLTANRFLPAPEDPRPASPTSLEGGGDRIYELAGAGTSTAALRLVAEAPPGLQGGSCTLADFTGLGTGKAAAHSYGRSDELASADGSTLIYTAPIEEEEGQPCGEGTPNQFALFACDLEAGPCAGPGAHLPLQLNAPPPSQCSAPSPCATATTSQPLYDGVSPDGRYVWFTTEQPLVDSDTDTTNDLYVARLEGGELKQLDQASAGEATPSHPSPGSGAAVGLQESQGFRPEGVVRASADGTHAAFESGAVLTTHPNSNGAPGGESAAQGADNIYVYDAQSGETKFVAQLPGADRPLWRSGQGGDSAAHVVFTPDGRYLFFTSSGRLTADDTDSAPDLYRYDFSTGRLTRLSFGRNGNDANGNDSAFPVEFELGLPQTDRALIRADDSERSVSADGQVAIFRTVAPLVSRDTNAGQYPGCGKRQVGTAIVLETGCDVYEWEAVGHGTCTAAEDGSGGCVRLISDGLDPHGVYTAAISSTGRDIAFQTQRGELPSDTDGIGDVYDAREGGGFPYTPPGTQCGTSETCHGEATHESLPINPLTEKIEHGTEGEQELKCAKGRHKVKRNGQVRCVPNKKYKRRRRHHKRSAHTNRGGGR